METTREKQHFVLREGYAILLRGEAELELPLRQERIADYYRRVAEACLKWAQEAEGSRISAEYRALQDNRERARFGMATYRLQCCPVWQTDAHAAWVCRSRFCRPGSPAWVRMSAQVWNLEEETLLPPAQLLRLCRPTERNRRPPFRADGVYPQNGRLIFFKNPVGSGEMTEFAVAFGDAEGDPAEK